MNGHAVESVWSYAATMQHHTRQLRQLHGCTCMTCRCLVTKVTAAGVNILQVSMWRVLVLGTSAWWQGAI